MIVEFIATTTTRAGLKVRAGRHPSRYEAALKPAAEQMDSIKIVHAEFRGEWNYTIHPGTA